ncbi:MAG: hypothetical protein LBT49_04500 [Prevotellaceae bacterium]|nr:hypothetical protein [Prevotellaceae bacterium]
MKTNVICLLLLLTGTGLFAQNGVTLSNYKAQVGTAGSSTLTIDIRWAPPADPKKVWSDTVWVFADYNNAGTMTRLPLAKGATLANPSWSVAKVIEEPGNPNGVWVVGDARSAGSFSATLQMVATCGDARPCVRTGVCVYAINYPPVGRYTAYNQIHFTGTPPFHLTYRDGGNTVVQNSLAKPFTVPAGKTVASFTDASRAPGTLICKPPVVQTLTASGSSYCAGSGVTLALSGTDPGAAYQLYKDGTLQTGITLTGTGGAMSFPGSFKNGAYSVRVVAGAFCGASMAGAPVVIEHPLPNNPTVTAGSRCGAGTVQLSASSPGADIDWYDAATGGTRLAQASGAYTTPGLSATTTYYAEARVAATGCKSTGRTAVTATVHALPTATVAAKTICSGQTAGLTATVTDGNVAPITYMWNVGGSTGTTNVPSHTSQILTATTAYTVQLRNANGCTGAVSSSAAITVNVLPTATVAATELCSGQAATLTATVTAGNVAPITYTWNVGGTIGTTNYAKPPSHTLYASTTYTVQLTNGNGCTGAVSSPAPITLDVVPTGPVNFTSFNPASCHPSGTTWKLTDTRESNNVQTYRVRMMPDGRIWMIDDMKFGDKCNKPGFKGSNGSAQTGSKLTSISGYIYGDCRRAEVNGAGYWYDWAGAMQLPNAYKGGGSKGTCAGTSSGIASGPAKCPGICPVGWHIPTGGTDGEFRKLDNAFTKLLGAPCPACWTADNAFAGILAGYWSDEGGHYEGSGFYWASTAHDNSRTYSAVFESDYFSYENGLPAKNRGLTLRCVKNY